jgi:vacuolar-type H+-ATPase subunit I/STV1
VSDRDRSWLAATISVVSVFFAVVGLALLLVTPFIGGTFVMFGAIGAVQAVLVGVGLVTISDARHKAKHERKDERP